MAAAAWEWEAGDRHKPGGRQSKPSRGEAKPLRGGRDDRLNSALLVEEEGEAEPKVDRDSGARGAEELQTQAAEGGGWTELWVDALQVRFSQEQIHPFFHRRGPIQEVLQEVGYEPGAPSERAEGDSDAAPTVRLIPPFEPIRCVRHPELHQDWISLDNRRLYALQLTAVERWPVRCLARIRVNEEARLDLLRAEAYKLEQGGLSPLGKHAGKPRALMEHLCGDIEVLIASRGAAWEAWHPLDAVLARCDDPPPGCVVEEAVPATLAVADAEREACTRARREAREASLCERAAHEAVAMVDEGAAGSASAAKAIALHAEAAVRLRVRLEVLRHAAAAANGLLVRRVGAPGERDGYISVAAQVLALRKLHREDGSS